MDVVKEIAKENIRRAFHIYGIEGTEDKIKELYSNNSGVQEYMLGIYGEILNYKKGE